MPTRPPVHGASERPSGAEYEQQRNQQHHRKAIRSWRWQKFREWYLRQYPLCVDCGRLGGDVHHKRELALHHEDLCDQAHVETLCHRCHSTRTNRALMNPVQPGPRFVVCGPPASGKTTWVQERAKPGDIVWDADQIMGTLCAVDQYPRPLPVVLATLEMREALLSYLQRERPECAVYLIVARATDAKEFAQRISAQLVVLDTPESTCVARVRADAKRAVQAADQIKAIRDWWAEWEWQRSVNA